VQGGGRRQRRRQETIDEILAVASQIMAEAGAGGLALGEIARRMGIQPPSLYVYFDSKNAIYDAVFARGWETLLGSMAPLGRELDETDDAGSLMLLIAQHFVRWAVENPAYAQLMFWRPVPGFEPSDAAFAPTLEMTRRTTQLFGELQRRGVLRADVDVAEATTAWTAVISGVISQHLANEPTETFDHGRFTRLLPALTSMFLSHYGPQGELDDSANNRRRGRNAGPDDPRRGGTARNGAERGDARAASRPR
jgi:AcrR family transcriptional regulator